MRSATGRGRWSRGNHARVPGGRVVVKPPHRLRHSRRHISQRPRVRDVKLIDMWPLDHRFHILEGRLETAVFLQERSRKRVANIARSRAEHGNALHRSVRPAALYRNEHTRKAILPRPQERSRNKAAVSVYFERRLHILRLQVRSPFALEDVFRSPKSRSHGPFAALVILAVSTRYARYTKKYSSLYRGRGGGRHHE